MWLKKARESVYLSDLCNEAGVGFQGEDFLVEGFCAFNQPKINCITVWKSSALWTQNLPDFSLAIVLKEGLIKKLKLPPNITIIESNDPMALLARLLNCFLVDSFDWGVNRAGFIEHNSEFNEEKIYFGSNVVIKDNVKIEDFVYIGDLSYIGTNVFIGQGTVIQPGVKILDDTVIGRGCFIGAGSVIGSEGFGYVFDGDKWQKVPQIGRVVIEDFVEIGSNVCIDRGTLGETVIQEGSRVDNLVQLGHNVVIGKRCVLCGQVGIAGSSTLGDDCILGGQVGVADHVYISNNSRVAGKSGVASSIKKSGDYAGYPALCAKDWRKLQAIQRRLLKQKKLQS